MRLRYQVTLAVMMLILLVVVSAQQKEILCDLKKQVKLRTVDGSEQPFNSLGWTNLVPSVSLNQTRYRTCAVVPSAGILVNSGLGKEVDDHQAVMRFNHAPTVGYEIDVGARTTLRLVNEQIPSKVTFQFNTSALYRNVTLLTWEKCPSYPDLTKWYDDGALFKPYEARRRQDPDQPFYVLHPEFVRGLWLAIQRNTQETIQRNLPTSGFIGILVMMSLCDEVHVYEYIPSTRLTDLCHYFEDYRDIKCSTGGAGSWHPVRFEKELIRRINTGSDTDLKRGRVTLPGFSAVNCDI